MMTLSWICGEIRQDRIRNDNIRDRERVGVAPIVEKWWKLGLGGWACKENTCRLCSMESRSITRGGGRSRETTRKTIIKDL